MSKGLGIAAIVIAILSILLPIFINFGALWLAMIFATGAIIGGERPLSIAAAAIGIAGLFFFAPASMAALAISLHNGSMSLLVLSFGEFALPAIALYIVEMQSALQSRSKD